MAITFSATTCSSSLTRASKPANGGMGFTNLDDNHYGEKILYCPLKCGYIQNPDDIRVVDDDDDLPKTWIVYLFIGDCGFEPREPLSPRRDDRREDVDELELEPDLEDGKLPDLEDGKLPDLEEGEPLDLEGCAAPGSVITNPECFITQNSRNTSSLSPWLIIWTVNKL